MPKQTITMTKKDLNRYHIIKELIEQRINGTEAAEKIRVSIRQVKRIKNKVKQLGPNGIIHGQRGKPGNHQIAKSIIKRVKQIIHNKIYTGFKPTFMSEKLNEKHHIVLSHETVRRLMIKEGLWKQKIKKQVIVHRSWRERKDNYGAMQQFDGSYHDWFEGRLPDCCLLASIDDASGRLTQAEFRAKSDLEVNLNTQPLKTSGESVASVFAFWQKYVETKGKPLNIYLDKFSTYKNNHKSVFDDPNSLTQFERAMRDLDINVIHAHSPQAKGRIERVFNTLQDRLIKELRLAKISTISQANEFLKREFIPKFNAKFAVQPKKQANLHRQLNKIDQQNLDRIFSIQDQRIVHNDFTVHYQARWFQLLEKQPTLILKKDTVLIEQRINDDIYISKKGQYLNYAVLPERPKKENEKSMSKITALTNIKTNWKPPINHPWRKLNIQSNKLTKYDIPILQRV